MIKAEEQGKENKKRFTRDTVYHALSLALILASVLFAVFRFEAVFMRMGQALEDLWTSVKYYGINYVHNLKLFKELELPTATVTEIPDGMTAILPVSWEEFTAFWGRYWDNLTTGATYAAYGKFLLKIVLWILYILSLAAVPGVVIFLAIRQSVKTVDNEHGKDSAGFRFFCRAEDKLYYPIKRFVQGYLLFLKGTKEEKAKGEVYRKVLKWVWLYNLNVITMGVEVAAWILYLVSRFDIASIFVIIAKIAVDATVALDFLPISIWCVIVYKWIDKRRREKGFKKLEKNEEKNKALLLEHPQNFLITGEPRVGKTQFATDVTITQETVFREKAKECMFVRQMQFPFFPWNHVEQTIKAMRKNKYATFNLNWIRFMAVQLKESYDIHVAISSMEKVDVQRLWTNACAVSVLLKSGLQAKDYLFGYDAQKYGVEYDNGLTIVSILESIRFYAEEFYIYSSPTPLSVSNYPIRFDIRLNDVGNFPLLAIDHFRRGPREVFAESQFNHIGIMDNFRLGKKKNPQGKYNNNFEIGALTVAEIGKERGNQRTNAGTKKDAEACNTANDLFEMDMKMRSHGTTIDYFTYFRIIADEQRAMDLLAELREIGSEVKVCNKKDPKIIMPCFTFGALLYETATYFTKKVNDYMKHRHGKRTLLYYLWMKAYAPIYNHYTKIYNTYGYYTVDLKIANNAQGETLTESVAYVWYISLKKVRSDVYDTGYFGVFYDEKIKRSKAGGINQMPQWQSRRPLLTELREVGSHHYDRIFEQFEIDAA